MWYSLCQRVIYFNKMLLLAIIFYSGLVTLNMYMQIYYHLKYIKMRLFGKLVYNKYL